MKYLILISLLALTSCSSKPVIMNNDDVKVSREAADTNCKNLGKITGSSLEVNATREQVLEDLKKTATAKGANYVVVKQFSDNGGQVTGIAYDCP